MGTDRYKINHIKLVYVIPKSSPQLSKFLVFSMSYQSVLIQRECKKKHNAMLVLESAKQLTFYLKT